MTGTFSWIGIALWLGLNAVVAAWCMYVARPDSIASENPLPEL